MLVLGVLGVLVLVLAVLLEDSPLVDAVPAPPLEPYPCAYQPPPFRWNAVRLMSFLGWACPHFGQVSGGASPTLAHTSST